jgi:hypothetical protein
MRLVYLICIHISSWTDFWNFVLAAALFKPNWCPGTAFSCVLYHYWIWSAIQKKHWIHLPILQIYGGGTWLPMPTWDQTLMFLLLYSEQLKKGSIHLFSWIVYFCDWKVQHHHNSVTVPYNFYYLYFALYIMHSSYPSPHNLWLILLLRPCSEILHVTQSFWMSVHFSYIS